MIINHDSIVSSSMRQCGAIFTLDVVEQMLAEEYYMRHFCEEIVREDVTELTDAEYLYCYYPEYVP